MYSIQEKKLDTASFMHVDHVGWNTPWTPTVPNAKYIMSQQEWTHRAAVRRDTPLEHLTDSVLPIIEAGRAVFVTNDYALDDED
jgi:hypothetical protein